MEPCLPPLDTPMTVKFQKISLVLALGTYHIHVCLVFLNTLMHNYCKFGNFREGLFSRNFAYAKCREIKILTKWRDHSVVC